MKLSIIIVNYNVKCFLAQCLHAVELAIAPIAAEVVVVDNHSTDHSVEYLRAHFPWVRIIANAENIGFARANNQALETCTGEYVLFLNPDTLVPEDCFSKCLNFIAAHPETGGLGIRMLDGTGRFLPESKRAFPSPLTAFFKLMGLSALFPRSKIFNQYSLGYLDPLKNHAVDVLSGAFMLVPKRVLAQTGGFDAQFFMYGEDIDLSYRIQQAGFTNYYFSETAIIHFKGESTRKGSLNYVLLFYNAMRVFVKKNYRGSKAGFFSFFILMAIGIRAAFSVGYNSWYFFLQKIRKHLPIAKPKAEHIWAIANDNAYASLVNFLHDTKTPYLSIKQIPPNENFPQKRLSAPNTAIFCQDAQFSWKQIIAQVQQMSGTGILFRFHACNSNTIIGSDSKETSGEALMKE